MRFGLGFFFGNYTDWDRFEALERGESPGSVGPMLRTDEEIYREQCALADLTEPLGFDTLWTFEQHASPYLLVPQPHQFLTYFAARTRRIDVGSMIVVLPWHNPFRVAEEVAMLTHFLGPNRKYFMGVGRGLARRNFDAMGVDMNTSRERFNEVLDIIQLAFSQEVFSFDGQFFSYKNASVRPRPVDASMIEYWGTWTSEPSLRNMAERGLQPMTTPNKTLESYLEDMELFNQVREEHGFGPAKPPVLQVPMFCSESAQEVEENIEQWFHEYVDTVVRQYEIGTQNFASGKGYESYASQGSDYGSGTVEDAYATLVTKMLRDAIYGTPDQCAERVMAHYEKVRPSELVALNCFATMTTEQSEKSLRLYAEKVVPRFADLRKDEEAPARSRAKEPVGAHAAHVELPSV
jgi:alkanesulfonate monooxygenase SsuD/methylene tetrahydromethanopterin reductase-like flavin-dependent oxidoreductase (luciferase family)